MHVSYPVTNPSNWENFTITTIDTAMDIALDIVLNVGDLFNYFNRSRIIIYYLIFIWYLIFILWIYNSGHYMLRVLPRFFTLFTQIIVRANYALNLQNLNLKNNTFSNFACSYPVTNPSNWENFTITTRDTAMDIVR